MNPAVAPPLDLSPAARLPVWRSLGRLAPLVVLWAVMVGWLAYLLYTRADWPQEADEADISEWLSETRVFRKSLPELADEYGELLTNQAGADPARLLTKYDELATHLAALAEPTRKYSGKLPLFPELYSISVDYPGIAPPPGRTGHPAWRSPVPRPGMDDQSRLQLVELPTGGSGRAVIRCEYRVHTNHRFEQEQQNRRYWQGVGIGFLTFATLLAGGLGIGAMLREQQRFERERELERKQAQSALAAEHRERELAEAQRAAEELERKVLQGELEKAKIEGRAAEAERSALEMKSQLYASIGIMAGSYAHNIKNLLVRPNDLLSRCIEVNGLSGEQEGMLREVKTTLGTVTERLQQILRTVRRDPNRAEMTRVDLAGLVRESLHTWAGMAWDKWKVRLVAEVPVEPLTVNGDLSHLQQAVENLVFNARDATFEMRNHLREDARRNPALDPAARKQRLIEAAAWKGEVHLRARREDGFAVLEVQDNGIGMTDEVRENCLKTHFTTKRDNALYEGYSAGMGLGLSFVAVVLEHHGADLEIESAPLHGALFRVRIPLAEGERS